MTLDIWHFLLSSSSVVLTVSNFLSQIRCTGGPGLPSVRPSQPSQVPVD